MTGDDRGGLPHELRGPAAQATTGQPVSPVLAPSPGPGALAGSSPGVGPGVVTPIASPTLPDPTDPATMTLLLARMAGELFGGSSIVPAPSPQQVMTTSGAEPPGYPGFAPALVAGPTGTPLDPTTTTAPSDPAAALIGAGSAPGDDGVAPAIFGVPAASPHGDVPSSTTAWSTGGAPSSSYGGGPVSGDGVPSSPLPSRGGAPPAATYGGAPSVAPTAGLPDVVPTSPRTASSHAPAPPTGLGSSYSAPATATAPATTELPSNPFTGAPELDALLGAVDPARRSESGALGLGPGEALHLPMFDPPALGLEPYFIPGAEALGLDAPPRIEGGGEPGPDPVIRDLGGAAFDPYAIRRDFPILEERIHGKRLVWLDNAATTQKPRAVIDRLSHYYAHENSNVHRAAHTLAARATDAFESGRTATRRLLNAGSDQEIVFVRGATEGINLIAQAWGRRHVGEGDEILITHLEHHANIVPWQMLCAEKGARLRVAPVDDRGDVILEAYERLLNPRTKIVAFPHVSNALGTITPAREMIELAHRHGARVLVDGAQAVSHMRVDVQQLNCDWYVFSGHKVFAPTGIGALYGKRELLEYMPPWQGGGNMIQEVTFERTVYQPPPWKFEAGTGSIADAAGLGAALEYVMRTGIDVIDRYEHELLVYGTERLAKVPGLTMIGNAVNKAGVMSFVLDGQRTEDVGALLDKEGIAVRSGHHCAQPIHRRFGLQGGTVRASLAFYNVCEDIDALVDALHRLQAGRG